MATSETPCQTEKTSARLVDVEEECVFDNLPLTGLLPRWIDSLGHLEYNGWWDAAVSSREESCSWRPDCGEVRCGAGGAQLAQTVKSFVLIYSLPLFSSAI